MNFLAIRYLLARKKQTLLTLIGIVLGTAGYISISGIMLGFQSYLLDQFINSDCHVRIQARDEPITEKNVQEWLFPDRQLVRWITPPSGRRGEDRIDNIPAWVSRLTQDPRVEAFAMQLRYPLLTQFEKTILTTQLIGINPEDQLKVSKIAPYMTHTAFIKGTDYLEVDNSAMTYMIINAIKEINSKYETLNTKYEEQKKQNEYLQKQIQELNAILKK